ncbi:unnamed protein product [Macrosiphum euphorbiae]|uniref:Uncharacterized protein n=1 Tax=Macrosiphum euphorbiae TaxID=13131 RepID=A0AAV0XWS2_9HEMI|nr:unnamed protein product [Macrosiphum euphorbiae]
MDDEIQTWWEIPSIVHFCKIFTLITKDISRIDINEFENAVEENSYLLTDMAIRFTQICVSYDPNTNEWWNIMKELFRSKCIIYNFKYSLESATYFDDLTRKQKVEALYIFCNFILDVKDIQNKLSNRSKICHMLNVTPLGYDLNKSVYWYFGTNKLYREDFENSSNSSTNLPVEYYLNGKIQYAPYPSGVFGSGKWNTICNNIDDWYSLADITKYSKNIIIRYLHKAISNIIINLPKIKKNKSYYAYLKPLKSICQRSLRSMDVMNAECKNLITNSSVIQRKQYSQNVKKNQTKHGYDSTVSQINETSNPNVHGHNQNISYSTNAFNNDFQIETLNNKPALKLQLRSGNKNVLDKWAKKNIVFDKVLCINLERCDQENTHN